MKTDGQRRSFHLLPHWCGPSAAPSRACLDQTVKGKWKIEVKEHLRVTQLSIHVGYRDHCPAARPHAPALVSPRGALKMTPLCWGNCWAIGTVVNSWSNPLLGNQSLEVTCQGHKLVGSRARMSVPFTRHHHLQRKSWPTAKNE